MAGDLGALALCDHTLQRQPLGVLAKGTLARTEFINPPHMSKALTGLDRLGVMGENLVLNCRAQWLIPAFGSTPQLARTKDFMRAGALGLNIVGANPGGIRGCPGWQPNYL